MKKLLILLLMTIGLASCKTTFDQTLLRPTDEKARVLLPRLELNKESENIRYSQANAVTTNSKMYTLFERELENICTLKGEKVGYIEPIVIVNEVSMGMGLYAFSMFTGTILNMVGMPLYGQTFQLEVEFQITDLQGERIWKKTYYDEDKYYVGLYYNVTRRADEQVLIMYRSMISSLKKDIESDYQSIVNALN